MQITLNLVSSRKDFSAPLPLRRILPGKMMQIMCWELVPGLCGLRKLSSNKRSIFIKIRLQEYKLLISEWYQKNQVSSSERIVFPLSCCAKELHILSDKGRFLYKQSSWLLLKIWAVSSHLCCCEQCIHLTFGGRLIIKSCQWKVGFFIIWCKITRWLNLLNVLTVILKGSAQVAWIWYIVPDLKQHHNPFWMYAVSRPFCISDGRSERIQKKKKYSEICMAVTIHFALQEIHIICNAKLLFYRGQRLVNN